MERAIRTFIATIAALMLTACGIYSFSGTSIQADVNTINIDFFEFFNTFSHFCPYIDFFEYKAMKVNPTLANDLTEAIRTQFRKMTRLEQVEMDGDLQISGQIVGYDISPAAVTADEIAARNKLTISVKVDFENKKHPEDSFTGKSFSGFAEYDSTNSLDAVENTLCTEIIAIIVEDIFNATVAQW